MCQNIRPRFVCGIHPVRRALGPYATEAPRAGRGWTDMHGRGPPPTIYAIHHGFATVCACAIGNMKVRDKRCIYNSMRRAPPMTVDSFLPVYGVTVGEFSVFNVLASTSLGAASTPTTTRTCADDDADDDDNNE